MTWTKLHDLCSRGGPTNTYAIVQRARAVSEEVIRVDDRGYNPLHLAVVSYDPSVEVVKALLNANPSAVMEKDLHGDTPLHLALRPNANPSVIKALLDSNPNVAYGKNKEGLLPLHAACRYCPANDEIIGLLIEANPSALNSRTKMGNLAPRKSKVVPSLVPSTTFELHNQHLVLDGTASPTWRCSQIISTVEMQFEERSHQFRDGSYPLLMAIKSGAPQAVIEMLIREAPDALSFSDKFGMNCLHHAVSDSKTVAVETAEPPTIPVEVIEMLHSLDPKLIESPDKVYQNLPLHTACQGGCSVDVAKSLIQAYPAAIHVKNRDGMHPLDVAKSCGNCSQDVLYLLELGEEADVDI